MVASNTWTYLRDFLLSPIVALLGFESQDGGLKI